MFKQLINLPPTLSGNININYNIDSDELSLSSNNRTIYTNENKLYPNDLFSLLKENDLSLYDTPLINKFTIDYDVYEDYYLKTRQQCNNITVHTPLYAKNTPDYLVILDIRHDTPVDIYNIEDNDFNVLNVIKLNDTKLGKYLNSYFDTFINTISPFEINTENDVLKICGINYTTGLIETINTKQTFQVKESFLVEQKQLNDLFKTHNLIHPYLFNISFTFESPINYDSNIIGVYVSKDTLEDYNIKLLDGKLVFDFNNRVINEKLNVYNKTSVILSNTEKTKTYSCDHTFRKFKSYCEIEILNSISLNNFIEIYINTKRYVFYPDNELSQKNNSFNIFSNNGNVEDILIALQKSINETILDLRTIISNNRLYVYGKNSYINFNIKANSKIIDKNLSISPIQTYSNYSKIRIEKKLLFKEKYIEINDNIYEIIDSKNNIDDIINYGEFKYDYLIINEKIVDTVLTFNTIKTNYNFYSIKPIEFFEIESIDDINTTSIKIKIETNLKSIVLSELKNYSNTISYIHIPDVLYYEDIIKLLETIELTDLRNQVFNEYESILSYSLNEDFEILEEFDSRELYEDSMIGENVPFKSLFNIDFLSNIPHTKLNIRNINYKTLNYFYFVIDNISNGEFTIYDKFDISMLDSIKFDYFNWFFKRKTQPYYENNILKFKELKNQRLLYSIIDVDGYVDFLNVRYNIGVEYANYKFSIVGIHNDITINSPKTPFVLKINNYWKTFTLVININSNLTKLSNYSLYNENSTTQNILPFSINLAIDNNGYNLIHHINNYDINQVIEKNDIIYGYLNNELKIEATVVDFNTTKININNIQYYNFNHTYDINAYTKIIWKVEKDTTFLLNPYLLSNFKQLKYDSTKDYVRIQNYKLYYDNDISLQQKLKTNNFSIKRKSDFKTIYSYTNNKKFDINFIIPQFQYQKKTNIDIEDEYKYPLINYWLWNKIDINLNLSYTYLKEIIQFNLDSSYNIINGLYNEVKDIYFSSFYELLDITIYYNDKSTNGFQLLDEIYPSTSWIVEKAYNFSIVENILQINTLKEFDTIILIRYKLC